MRFLFHSIRRLLIATLVIVLLACALEVGLRVRTCQLELASGRGGTPGIPRQQSRATVYELPIAWRGTGVHAESGEELLLRVNSLGLRGPEFGEKPPGSLRILCAGDDFTLADGLDESQTYSSQLETLLRPRLTTEVEVINAGLPSGCLLTEYVQFRRRLEQLGADVVIVHVDVSDAADDAAVRPHLRFDDTGDPIAVVCPALDVPAGSIEPLASRFALVDWCQRTLGRRVVGGSRESRHELFQRQLLAWGAEAENPAAPRWLQPLARLKSVLDHSGAMFVVSVCPNAWQTAVLTRSNADGQNDAAVSAPALVVAAACRSWGVPFVDATPAFVHHPEPASLFLRDGDGLSTAGHALYAEQLARALTATPADPVSATTR